MSEHRTDWHRLSITVGGDTFDARGWWFETSTYATSFWVLDRVVDGDAHAYPDSISVTDVGPVDVLVLPAPSGPVVRKPWGWECGDTEAADTDDADGWAEELPQNIADCRAIAAHIRALPVPTTLAGDVATLRAWVSITSALAPGMRAAMTRVIDAADAGEGK